MQHGRDHDNRTAHYRSRYNNTPPDPESEPTDEELKEELEEVTPEPATSG